MSEVWSIPEDVTEFKLNIPSPGEFWSLMDLLSNEESEFIHNRSTILQAFKEDHMYVVCGLETDENFASEARRSPIFMWTQEGGLYTLPAFCVLTPDNKVLIIWVSQKARRQGIGSTLLRLCGTTTPCPPILSGSEAFWSSFSE
jgi:hypothetical protein